MEVRQRGLIAGFLTAALLVAPLAAEAKRAGGGKSHGMSRSSAPSQSYQQPRQATPAQQPAAPAKSGPGVGGMVAAGVAGAAIGAVAANALADDKAPAASEAQVAPQQEEEKGGIPSWIWMLLAAAAAFFVFRKMGAKKKLATNNPYAPNSSANNAPFGQAPTAGRPSNDNSNIFGQNVGGSAPVNNAPFGAAYTNSGSQLPDGTEPATF